MRRRGFVGIIVFAWLALAGVARVAAADTGEAKAGESAAGKGGIPVQVTWKNDFVLFTPNEAFMMKIRGNLHFDTKTYFGDSANPTQFDVRRARIDLQGALYTYITFRVQAELADKPYVRNAWADFRFRDWLHLRGGQMKPPFSTSWWTLDNRLSFLERGAGTPVYPYFDRGWWLWGDLFDEAVTWNLAGFTGAGMDFDEPGGDVDDSKDWFGRLFLSPLKWTRISALRGLSLCAQGSLGDQTVPTTRFELKGYSAAIRDDKFWVWKTEDPGSGAIGGRNRWGFEVNYVWGALSLSSEYLAVDYRNIRVGATDGTEVFRTDGHIRSWSTWAGFFLTGEGKTVSNFGWRYPVPLVDFDPVHLRGIGAWELLVRYTRTETSKGMFRTVAYGGDTYRVLQGAPTVDEYSVCVNWSWNPLVRWQFNYVHLEGEGILSGGTKPVSRDDMFGFRLILKF